MDEKIKIYVCYHNRQPWNEALDSSLFVPIHCGRAIYDPAKDDGSGDFLPELGDDTGDNISEKNRFFCELTGMYWIWKNDHDSDIVGLNHYSRIFHNSEEDNRPITRDVILAKLEEYDFIVTGSTYKYDHDLEYASEFSAYRGYAGCHVKRDFDYVLEACSLLFPELYDRIYYEVMNSCEMNICNIMVCRKKLFDEYCSFLFPVLFELEKRVDIQKDYSNDYQRRAAGFVAERLFRPWLLAKHYSFIDNYIPYKFRKEDEECI